MSYAGLLTRIPLFAGLTVEEVDRLQGLTTEAGFPAGRNVVTVGEPGDSLYIVVSGSVQILYPGLNQDFELARLGPGDFFGEMALLNDEPRSATVHTLEPTTTLMLAKDDFRQVVQSSSGLAFRLLEVLSRRIRSADAQMGGLSEQALKDPLTGLLNRRAFHERLAEEGDRARRYGDQFSLILMDVDQFKLVNDSLGHDVGDEVLKWLGRILTEHTRAADAPFRVGGEEFRDPGSGGRAGGGPRGRVGAEAHRVWRICDVPGSWAGPQLPVPPGRPGSPPGQRPGAELHRGPRDSGRAAALQRLTQAANFHVVRRGASPGNAFLKRLTRASGADAGFSTRPAKRAERPSRAPGPAPPSRRPRSRGAR